MVAEIIGTDVRQCALKKSRRRLAPGRFISGGGRSQASLSALFFIIDLCPIPL
ncbi:hypothetical protein PAMC26510_05040 [Caballeronia sordidicola]|uniref:Uncharacterized protein n=1 Tax=Caballeronia sordidicola TaxID=196367 RepID=A0A242N8B9_CABSO|nr:hypothetical protein PAMC26577_07715 [Caballeronia sordidicola]OTP79868.1 hypothetical protein PAMC26510_05040 [Caballeronia sordidicola]